eukprot:CAMPEP_0204825450 /NCGR_PEP_ID=MMETSP1346-20131115/3339_1 /ASSEMBLY_ACC=CAM_ASM_000771 /TAXON_ID=215587 /ORGANISM="Aplanochytrium stocchinoi, Strain GSBS06" /LENGTH=432 /DNA_ID=CAMNT_0051953093 /DNA_START=107 /DNA_END=1405 /DNA_ORIENTATION=+
MEMETFSDVLLIRNIQAATVVTLENRERFALLGEIHPVNVFIDPKGDRTQNARLHLNLNPVPESWNVTFLYKLGEEEEWEPIPDPENVEMGEMISNYNTDRLSFPIGILFECEYVNNVPHTEYSVKDVELTVSVLYEKYVDRNSLSHNYQLVQANNSLQISCGEPFTVDFKIIRRRSLFLPYDQLSHRKEEDSQNFPSQVVLEEPFVLSMTLCCGIPPGHELILHNIEYESKANVNVKLASSMVLTKLNHGEHLTGALNVTVNSQIGEIQLGDIFVKWSTSDTPLSITKSRVRLPTVTVLDPAFTFSLATKPDGWVNVGSTVDISLTVKNNTEAMQKISVQILQQMELENLQDASNTKAVTGSENISQQRDDQFYVTGSKKQSLALGPRNQQEAVFKCVALEPGNNSKALALLVHSLRYNSMQTLPLRIAVR